MGIKNKQGMFFTLFSIIILSVFFLSFLISYESLTKNSERQRVETMNNHLFSIENDLNRQIYLSSFRSILSMIKTIIEDKNPIDNATNRLLECFYNGTIKSKKQEFMDGVTFFQIQDTINNFARKANIIINLTNPRETIFQNDPWHVNFNLLVDLYATDTNNLVSWNRTENITVSVPIENFEDPVYILGTGGIVSNKINKSYLNYFVTGTNVTNLLIHSTNSYYINNINSPSFLMRLEGNYSSNIYGIESLVNLDKINSQGLEVKDKSVVDYIYFSSNNPISHQVQGMPSWFKLDSDHYAIYNASGLIL